MCQVAEIGNPCNNRRDYGNQCTNEPHKHFQDVSPSQGDNLMCCLRLCALKHALEQTMICAFDASWLQTSSPHHPHHHLTEHQTNFFSSLIIKTAPPSSPPWQDHHKPRQVYATHLKIFCQSWDPHIHPPIRTPVHYHQPDATTGPDGTEDDMMEQNLECEGTDEHVGTEPYMSRNGS